MSAEDLLYEPVKRKVDAICGSCNKRFDYDVDQSYPPYCPNCQQSANVDNGCCGSGECGCFTRSPEEAFGCYVMEMKFDSYGW